jgi:hypothetical protein
MRTVYKFPINTRHNYETTWLAPAGSKSIYTGLDPNGTPCIWMDIQVDEPNDTQYRAVVIGTGRSIPSNEYKYLGSFMEANTYVWHIYVTH